MDSTSHSSMADITEIFEWNYYSSVWALTENSVYLQNKHQGVWFPQHFLKFGIWTDQRNQAQNGTFSQRIWCQKYLEQTKPQSLIYQEE